MAHRIVILFFLASALTLAPFRSDAQSGALEFASMWSQFLAACGPVIADPATAMVAQTTFEGYSDATWNVNQDGTYVQALHYNPNSVRYINYHLQRSEADFSLVCQLHISDIVVTSSDAVAEITTLFETSEDMTIAGGRVEPLPGSSVGAADTVGYDVYNFVISGAFPGEPLALVIVHIIQNPFTETVLSVSVYHSWENEE